MREKCLRYLQMCEDFNLGFFDRSAAAKKGWETRKANGGWAGKWMTESGKKIPSGADGGSQVGKVPDPQKNDAGEVPAAETPVLHPDAKRFREMAEWNKGREGDMWVG